MSQEEHKGTDTMSHQTGTNKGEEQIENQGKEAGREDETAERTARDSTSIDPETKGPISEDMPNMPPA